MLNHNFYFIFTLILSLNIVIYVNSSFSKPPECDNSNGCSCKPGYWGRECRYGRLRLKEETGIISDGAKKYLESSKAVWLIETSRPNSTIELELEEFATECSWDHLYVYSGKSIHAPLVGTLSGLLRDHSIDEVAKEPIRHLRIKSDAALLYFYSDANYVLTGFNINYRISKDCSSQCNYHGYCDSHGNCVCDPGWKGSSCNVASCPMNCVSGVCNNVTRQCQGCDHGFTGPSCNVTSGTGYWTHVPANHQDVMTGRASHASGVVGDWLWVYGGYSMNKAPFNDLIRYQVSQNTWEVVEPNNSSPVPQRRYGHSLIVANESFIVFGGIVGSKTVSELWLFNTTTRKWTKMLYSIESEEPLAVSGHSATLVGNKMVVIFGYGNKEGYTQRVQVFDLVTRRWKLYNVSSLVVQATFGHSSAYDRVSGLIYVHGGYRAAGNNAEISSDLNAYMSTKNKWLALLRSGYPRFLHSSVLIGNLLLVFGGNTHNDTNGTQKKSKCYSSDFLLYDTRCNVWKKMSTAKSLSSSTARFGHSAVQVNGAMYITGGFEGTMLSDVLKYTTGDCSAQSNRSSCLQAYPTYGCVRSINTGTCIGPLHAQVESNNIEMPVCPANPVKCSTFKSCNRCTLSPFKCAWCGTECKESKDKCYSLKYAITEENKCPLPLPPMPGSCDKSKSECVHTACDQYTSCETCIDNKRCMWCESQRQCVGLNAYVISFPYGQCHEWTKDKCSDVRCDAMKTCYDCHTLPGCGWCDDGSGTGLGQCIGGGDNRPFNVGHNSSSIVSSHCLQEDSNKRWFFIECPACQCNGHSTCDDQGKCIKCQHNTNGSHCQTCATGYFGDAKNGGHCQPCKCNGHSSVCHPGSGVCDCRTKGITGNNCEQCSRLKGYYGNATNGGYCYYNLTSGYLFTFNVTGTTGISFLNVPRKDDRDVLFTITITGSSALVNVTYKTNSQPERALIQAKRVGTKFEHSFKHDDYDFGGPSRLTFFVYVYDISGICVVEISFSQLTPFMLLKFFLTFFGCFFSILVVTFVAWKIRVKYNNYAMRRQRQVEMHQMANRPSSTIRLHLENNNDIDKRKPINPVVTLQPFARENLAVATILMRLPSLPNGLTPVDQSGLCLGTVLMDMSTYRMPSIRHVRNTQKKLDKRTEETTLCI